jgi:hypothetical protein
METFQSVDVAYPSNYLPNARHVLSVEELAVLLQARMSRFGIRGEDKFPVAVAIAQHEQRIAIVGELRRIERLWKEDIIYSLVEEFRKPTGFTLESLIDAIRNAEVI